MNRTFKRWVLEIIIVLSIFMLSITLSSPNYDNNWVYLGIGSIYGGLITIIVELYILYKAGKKMSMHEFTKITTAKENAIAVKESTRLSKITCEVLRIDKIEQEGGFITYFIVVIQNQKRKGLLIGKNDWLYDIIVIEELKVGDVFINEKGGEIWNKHLK